MDHMLYVGNVEPSSGDVGGDEEASLIPGKSLQVFQASFLMHLGVKAEGSAFEQSEEINKSEEKS
jgi:hypothetical protein